MKTYDEIRALTDDQLSHEQAMKTGERLEKLEQRIVNGNQLQFNGFWQMSVRLLHDWRERKLTDAEAERQADEIERWL